MLSKKLVKYIQSLSHKKLRDEEGVFVAEGPKVVSELLASGIFSCKIICAEKDWILANENSIIIPHTDIHEIDEDLIKKISSLKTPNKVVAIFKKRELNPNPLLTGKISLILDEISDPGNMGTIIRIADWFAIENIICSVGCVDCYNPKVVQSTMGSLARVDILYTDLKTLMLTHKSIHTYAATLTGKDVGEFRSVDQGFLLIGNEAKGVSEQLLTMAKDQITIPRYGHAESLNAAVATGIILSHLKNSYHRTIS